MGYPARLPWRSRVTADNALIPTLHNIATRLRIESIRSTTAAGSGHPSTCCSAADIVATLFFAEMRFDPKRPQDPDNDRFVLSKGHAAPLLFAAWAEAGAFDRSELLKLRQLGSDLEGHPTPRLPFVDVATGSLGQGLCAAVGIALNARRIGSAHRTYVLMGDGESAEGSVWEAADVARHYELTSLCGIIDVNALGQSQATALGHDMDAYARRWIAFGWQAIVVDGHDIAALLDAFERARQTTDRPTMILAKTIKGKGRVVRRRAQRLARAAAEERRGGEGDRRTPGAVPGRGRRPRRGRAGHPAAASHRRPRVGRSGGDGAAGLRAGRQRGDAGGLRHGAGQAGRSRPARRRPRRGRQELHVQRPVREGVPGPVLPELHRRAGHGGVGDGAGEPRRHRVPVDVRVLPDARLRLHQDGGDQPAEREAGRVARRRVDWRGRPVADGARGSRP